MKANVTSDLAGTRTKCPMCGRMILIRKDGSLRAHQGPDPSGIIGMDCNGSGVFPKGKKP